MRIVSFENEANKWQGIKVIRNKQANVCQDCARQFNAKILKFMVLVRFEFYSKNELMKAATI